MSDAAAGRRGLIDRVVAAYGGVGASMRSLLAERPSDAVLFSFLMVAALIGLAGAVAETAALPRDPADPDFADRFQKELAIRFIGAMILMPLGLYGLAALATPLLRALGGAGDGYETRAAFIWAMLVAAPLLFVQSLIDAAALAISKGAAGAAVIGASTAPHGALGLALFVAFWLLSLAALYIWSCCVATAHGLRPVRVFGGVLALLGVLSAILLAASALVG